MKTILSSILLAIVAISANAQSAIDNHIISGRVLDEEQEPLGYASVVLLSADSAFISSALTDDNGIISIPRNEKGKYVSISYIGYIPQTIEIEGDSIGTIQLMPDGNMLGEVVVKASRPVIKREVDRVVFNVSGTTL